jgi:hypothetical protein
VPQNGRDVVKFYGLDGDLIAVAALTECETGEDAMNYIQSEKLEGAEENPDFTAVSDVEAGIRDFVRNDVAYLRRPAPTPGAGAPADAAPQPNSEPVNNINSLIQRVAGTSLTEIENLIGELEGLRELLHTEGQRVLREISGYAQLSQAAMKSTRMLSENVSQWKRTTEGMRKG